MTKQLLPALLRNRGLKLIDLARLMNVDKATVSRWAQKEIPTDRVADISKVTGIPVTDLRPDLAELFGCDRVSA